MTKEGVITLTSGRVLFRQYRLKTSAFIAPCYYKTFLQNTMYDTLLPNETLNTLHLQLDEFCLEIYLYNNRNCKATR